MKKILFLMLVMAALVVSGCAKKEVKSEPAPEPVVQEQKPAEVVVEEEVVVVEEVPASPMELYEEAYADLPTAHTVVKGECLWWIAEYNDIYNDPFMWPLIFKANRDQIDNPDLIYPDQTLSIPRDFALDQVREDRKMAGAPWKDLDPPYQAIIPAQMRQELGYGF